MINFPIVQNEWYAQRDDRTVRVPEAINFHQYKLYVIIGNDLNSVVSQVMAATALNILARWCRILRVEIPPDIISLLNIKPGYSFIDVVAEIMYDADPYGQFTFGPVDEKDGVEILIIGKTSKKIQRPCYWINAAGWLAGVGYGTPTAEMDEKDPNIIGPAFAACLGNAEIFKQAIGLKKPEEFSIYYSLYDYSLSFEPSSLQNPTLLEQFDLGRIHQVGCGAVGSAFDFFLSLTNWKGLVDLIDYDIVNFTNCNRSLIFSAWDAVEHQKKVNICKRNLEINKGISVLPYDGSYSDFIENQGYLQNCPDLILCLANDQNVWATIQNNFPPIVIHATTTINWGLNFGRHVPKKEWCIMCRFSKEIKDTFIPPCSEGMINNETQEEPIYGVLPFLSPASAIILLAELAKIGRGTPLAKDNFIQFSMKGKANKFISSRRSPDKDCICKDQDLKIYPKEIIKTKFSNLFHKLTT
ncbi:MAG: ThiF family adenylyltransferase [Actinobacteria bacterium]|nr:ThiF family adenylyltransferase [Actinomycetota bacterium]